MDNINEFYKWVDNLDIHGTSPINIIDNWIVQNTPEGLTIKASNPKTTKPEPVPNLYPDSPNSPYLKYHWIDVTDECTFKIEPIEHNTEPWHWIKILHKDTAIFTPSITVFNFHQVYGWADTFPYRIQIKDAIFRVEQYKEVVK